VSVYVPNGRVRKPLDLTNQRFGKLIACRPATKAERLTTVARYAVKKSKGRLWLCTCDCGKTGCGNNKPCGCSIGANAMVALKKAWLVRQSQRKTRVYKSAAKPFDQLKKNRMARPSDFARFALPRSGQHITNFVIVNGQ
jgi:hypothetical protein